MLKRGYKLIICVVLVSALFIGFGSCFASAELPLRSAMQRFNAWVASALVAGQVTIGSTLAPVQSVLDSLSYGSGMSWSPTYTYQGATWDDEILNRSTIVVRPNSTTIDGVTYSDIIISSDASQKFRVNAFDVETAWNIASNSNGVYASGAGFVDGSVPVFDIDGKKRSQIYSVDGSGSVGNYSFSRKSQPNRYLLEIRRSVPISGYGSGYLYDKTITPYVWFDNTRAYYGVLEDGVSSGAFLNYSNGEYIASPFDFDWVSGTVPAEQLPEGSELHFLVPSEHTDSTHSDTNYNIPEFVTNYPDYNNPDGYTFEFDPSLNPDYQIDIDASDALGNLISAIIAAYLAGLIDTPSTTIEYTVDEPEPHPGVIDPLPDPDPDPDAPVPGTTIADTDWTKLDKILRWIQSTIDSIRHITESLQTILDSLFDQLQHIIESLESLPEQLLEDIETGPSKVFRKAIDVLKSLFLPLLLPIKAMMGLWHYVVEWLQSISSPFTWIFGVMSGTSSNMVLPIYAVLAGSICIAIYKALGR